MRVLVTPQEGLVDQVPVIAVEGVASGEVVTLTVSTTDVGGSLWRSRGDYRVGDDGVLDLPDRDRPWWDMQFANTGAVPVAFRMTDRGFDYTVEVELAGSVDSVMVRRVWGQGPPPETIRGDRWSLRLYPPHLPPGKISVGTVLLVPGSTGPEGLSAIAALLASHGYTAAVLTYMGQPGMADTFRELPVELFHDALTRLAASPGVDASRVAVYAVSVGTIAAAYAFSLPDAPPIHAMVMVAPSSVVWQALSEGGPPPKASSLTRTGTPVPYVPIKAEKLLVPMLRNAVVGALSRRPRSRAMTLLPAYAAGLRDTTAVDKAVIPVEGLTCPLMTIAGGQDAMWPAATMAQAIHLRRTRCGVGAEDVALEFADAGHFFRPPATPTTINHNESLVAGGTAEGSADAQRQAWTALLDFLATHLNRT